MEQAGAARDPEPVPPGGERRAAPRHTSSLKLACYPTGSGLLERRQARVRNVSRTGIGLAVDRTWPSGTNLMLEVPSEEGVKPVRARVIHSTMQMGGTYLVGCVFENALTDAEVQALSR